jgi:ABC-2 type transport system ATP-binding protein
MGFYDWMSGPHYLDWFSRLYGRRLTDHELAAHLTQVGLDAQDRRPIGAYSFGMRQRLGLARALLNDPKVVALDEPTNGLDPRGRHEVHDILLGLSRSKRVGILLCTHLLDDVERLCTRIGILHRGRSVLEGRLADLKKRGGLEELYLQHTPEAA